MSAATGSLGSVAPTILKSAKSAKAQGRRSRAWEEYGSQILVIVILGLLGFICFAVRLFAIIRFESVIHEYDPYFNYRTTKFLMEHGYEEFWNWYDESSWYPLGRVIGQTLFPGIMTTAYLMHKACLALGLPFDIREVCVFTAPVFSALCAWTTFLFVREAMSSPGGSAKASRSSTASALFAALFIGVSPSYMSRSVGGAFDNEAIAIFTLVLSFYTFLRAMRKGTIMSVVVACLAYFYMVVAWGGYVFIINVVSLYVIMLIFLDRFNDKYLAVYSAYYVIGSALCLNIPFVGFAVVTSSEHMISHGAFILGTLWYARKQAINFGVTDKNTSGKLVNYAIGVGFVLFSAVFLLLLALGKVRWSGRSMTLLDPSYATKHIPIITSVSEHQPPAWSSYLFDLHIPMLFACAGLFITLNSTNPISWFLGLYGVLAAYFSGIMVRLMLILSPAVCALGGVGVSYVLERAVDGIRYSNWGSAHGTKRSTKDKDSVKDKDKDNETTEEELANETIKVKTVPFWMGVGLVMLVFHMMLKYITHTTWASSHAYSHPSVIISDQMRDGTRIIEDDFREAYHWFEKNTHPNARIMSWWDYGYQSCYMGNRTVLVDNNTWNNTHIATVGMAFSSPEEVAYPVLQKLDVDYVFVVFGGVSRYSGDDINKFLWMVRIGGGVFPFAPREHSYYAADGRYAMGDDVSPTMQQSLMYRMSYHRFGENAITNGYDIIRRNKIRSPPALKYFEEAYTTSGWIVRIFKVKKAAERRPYGTVDLRNVLEDAPPAVY